MALKFYKKGQGYYTRLGTGLSTALITALGCFSLYNQLGIIRTGMTITPNVKAWIQAGVPVLIFTVICWLIFKLVNSVKFADFLIATEGEMKKVNWSSKKEIITSTKVVIITVAIMATLLALVDMVFANLFHWIGILQVLPS